ncbi:hypothetical protein V8E55_008363 [Tylopilus felleus]
MACGRKSDKPSISEWPWRRWHCLLPGTPYTGKGTLAGHAGLSAPSLINLAALYCRGSFGFSSPQQLAEYYWDPSPICRYFNVAGMAILVRKIFDYVITLEDEARWVWGRNWDVIRLVFTVSRYLPFAGTALTAYDAAREAALRSNSDPCGPSSGQSSSIVHMLGIIAAEVLLILRTYAYWQGNKSVLYGLLAYGAVTIAGAIGISAVRTQLIPGDSSVRCTAQSPPGCYLTAGRDGTLLGLLLLIFEMVYRDGMLYIVCIILITFANTILDGVFPVNISLPRPVNVHEKGWFQIQFSDLLDIPQITLHSVLASRIMFNLRKSAYNEHKGTTIAPIVFNDDAFYRSLNSVSNEFELSGNLKGHEFAKVRIVLGRQYCQYTEGIGRYLQCLQRVIPVLGKRSDLEMNPWRIRILTCESPLIGVAHDQNNYVTSPLTGKVAEGSSRNLETTTMSPTSTSKLPIRLFTVLGSGLINFHIMQNNPTLPILVVMAAAHLTSMSIIISIARTHSYSCVLARTCPMLFSYEVQIQNLQ